MHKWFSLALTRCSQLHSAQLEQWNDASTALYRAYMRCYECHMDAIYGHEHWCQGHRKQGCYWINSECVKEQCDDRSGRAQPLLGSTWKTIAWLLLCAFKDRHLKTPNEKTKLYAFLSFLHLQLLFNDLISKHLPADLPFPVWLTPNCIMPTERSHLFSLSLLRKSI